MALTAEHFLLRAHEAKIAARMSPDKTLSELFLRIAQSYEALAENEEWLDGKRSPITGIRLTSVPASAHAADGRQC
jgi:hypothetical protein